MWLQMVLFRSFLWLSNIPLYTCTISSLLISLTMDIYAASVACLMWIVLLWTLGCVYLFELWFFPEYMPKNRIAESYDSSIFSFQRNLVKSETEGHSVVSNSLRPHGLYSLWNSLGQNTGVSSLSLLQRIFPTQGSNLGLLHYRQILHQLSHKGRLYCCPYWL